MMEMALAQLKSQLKKHVSAIKQMLNVNKLKFWPNSSDKSHSIRPNRLQLYYLIVILKVSAFIITISIIINFIFSFRKTSSIKLHEKQVLILLIINIKLLSSNLINNIKFKNQHHGFTT